MKVARRTHARTATVKDLARFANSFKKVNDCWEWQVYSVRGYGNFSFQGHTVRAHRFIYELIHGDVIEQKVIDHLCRNPSCVNVKHLEAVTQAENVHRGDRTIGQNGLCANGHDITGENLYVNPANLGRQCRECNRLAAIKFRKTHSNNYMKEYRKKNSERLKNYHKEYMRSWRAFKGQTSIKKGE